MTERYLFYQAFYDPIISTRKVAIGQMRILIWGHAANPEKIRERHRALRSVVPCLPDELGWTEAW